MHGANAALIKVIPSPKFAEGRLFGLGNAGQWIMDCTHLIERLKDFEERMGVRLEALFADQDNENYEPPNSYLTINGELHPTETTNIQMDIKVVADIYDALGRLVARGEHWFGAEEFFAFETFELGVTIAVPNVVISKIRLYPKSA